MWQGVALPLVKSMSHPGAFAVLPLPAGNADGTPDSVKTRLCPAPGKPDGAHWRCPCRNKGWRRRQEIRTSCYYWLMRLKQGGVMGTRGNRGGNPESSMWGLTRWPSGAPFSGVAQLVEQHICNMTVGSSSLSPGANAHYGEP